ncbi:hypothetical protein WA026_002138 [Henosepilachna vigintioctopunctata]|uniref:Uncharacterized protein n=1 Tax=Henosepilachna vigintioctopunctata TaxID=420089 RepID=A0AAW1U1G8_9CUCU
MDDCVSPQTSTFHAHCGDKENPFPLDHHSPFSSIFATVSAFRFPNDTSGNSVAMRTDVLVSTDVATPTEIIGDESTNENGNNVYYDIKCSICNISVLRIKNLTSEGNIKYRMEYVIGIFI